MKHDEAPPRCPDPQCDTVAALMATTALGGDIDAAEQLQLLTYLSTCDRCRSRLNAYAGVAQVLPLSAPEAAPSPELRERILTTATSRAQPRRRSRRWQIAPDWRTALAGGFVSIALALALLLSQQYLRGQRQEAQLAQQQAQIERQQQVAARNRAVAVAAFGNEDARESQFVAGEVALGASGRVLISPSAPAVVVYARDLPPLAEGRIYQAWLQSAGVLHSLGSFTPDANGRVWAFLQPAAALPSPDAIFVTEEPAATSTLPTGPELLRASFP